MANLTQPTRDRNMKIVYEVAGDALGETSEEEMGIFFCNLERALEDRFPDTQIEVKWSDFSNQACVLIKNGPVDVDEEDLREDIERVATEVVEDL